MQTENKNHWYDGLFYDKIIAPNQDKSFEQIKDIIEKDSSLIDVGCGTGRLALQVADKCKSVVGVDLSERNISIANKHSAKGSFNNIKFYHSDINTFQKTISTRFDYAVISYVIHEIGEELRNTTLDTLSNIADKIIVVDYLAPRPAGFWSLLNELVEFAAGSDHYKNFKSFVAKNGITGLAKQNGLKIIKEIKNHPSTSHITVLIKPD